MFFYQCLYIDENYDIHRVLKHDIIDMGAGQPLSTRARLQL